MSDMKCPFCGKEMLCGGTICRYNPDCPIYDKPVPTEVLELLDRTRKALDYAKKALEELKDVIACPPDISYETGVSMYADGALQEITALEQKEE